VLHNFISNSAHLIDPRSHIKSGCEEYHHNAPVKLLQVGVYRRGLEIASSVRTRPRF
jgi:hypothetical protein